MNTAPLGIPFLVRRLAPRVSRAPIPPIGGMGGFDCPAGAGGEEPPFSGRLPLAWTGVARLKFVVIMTSAKSSGHATKELNDVFVIGAGASVPYGFPTGADLIQALRAESLTLAQPAIREILLSLGFHETILAIHPTPDQWSNSFSGGFCDSWTRKIRGSVILSIDQFLKNLDDEKLGDFGKRLMARQILHAEAKACKQPKPVDDRAFPRSMHSIDWIQQFLTRVDLLQNWEEYLQSSTFLTFNYDRVLEFFIQRFLVVDKNWKLDDARSFIAENLSIHHMNGFIGPLPQIPFGNIAGNGTEFDCLFDTPVATNKHVDWSDVANRMRTVWEDTELHAEAKATQAKAKDATSKAKRIFVIGTSFIRENFDAIGISGGPAKGWAGIGPYCTTTNLSKPQVIRAASMMGVPQNLINDHFFDEVANDFVVDHVVL